MEIIDSRYKQEYKKRANEIHNIIINAYSDYFNLIHITPYLEKYKPYNNEEGLLMLPARVFINSIVRTFQEELILIICSLENKNKNANSIIQLKAHLHEYISNFDSHSKSIFKMPKSPITNIESARNEAIAHINFNNTAKNVNMKEVKDRLDVLTKCFNSYLFGETAEYKINDKQINKLIKESKIGVQQLFCGFVNFFCNRDKL